MIQEKRHTMISIGNVRTQFPILEQKLNGNRYCYLDSAASTQKPLTVIEEINRIYLHDYSNVHRGVHTLSQRSTDKFEQSRKSIKEFINAREEKEIIFTKGTTESINLVAHSFGQKHLKEGDEIIISSLEHHANIVPWQLACERVRAKMKVIPIDDNGKLILEEAEKLFNPKVKLLALTMVSNALGLISPCRELIKMARTQGAFVLLDAAQAVQHFPVDVQELDCDFMAFSGHKLYGPGGTGVLYGKKEILSELPPYQSGGEMIEEVRFEGSTFQDIPFRFEAGTPNIADFIALPKALEMVKEIGFEAIEENEHRLISWTIAGLRDIGGIHIYGGDEKRAGAVSFNVAGIHHYDIGSLLDEQGIAIRTGHHCAQPLMNRFDITGTCRASFGIYNDLADVDQFLSGLKKAIRLLT